ncbi:PaaI family thioesterase [Nocardia sp. NPDC059180]|uniref:PaaI family thioesterase n=1 Tax=Nocardia sp. NPDC059180 TaxID=3346761 RepID=UPI00367AF98C
MTSNDVATIEISGGARTLHMEWDDPAIAVLGLLGLSREELLAQLRSGELAQPPLARLLNITLIDAEPGRMTLSLTPDERHVNFIGVIGGGIVATVLDIAMWGAVHLSLEDKSMVSTITMNTTMVRRISPDQGPLRAIAHAVHLGRSTAAAEARLVDSADKLYATATASFARLGGDR